MRMDKKSGFGVCSFLDIHRNALGRCSNAQQHSGIRRLPVYHGTVGSDPLARHALVFRPACQTCRWIVQNPLLDGHVRSFLRGRESAALTRCSIRAWSHGTALRARPFPAGKWLGYAPEAAVPHFPPPNPHQAAPQKAALRVSPLLFPRHWQRPDFPGQSPAAATKP